MDDLAQVESEVELILEVLGWVHVDSRSDKVSVPRPVPHRCLVLVCLSVTLRTVDELQGHCEVAFLQALVGV